MQDHIESPTGGRAQAAAPGPGLPAAAYQPLSVPGFLAHGVRGSRLAVAAAWLATLAASIALGVASIVYSWSGFPLHFGGVEVHLTVYPPLVLCMLWVAWFGFWWGAVPAWLATLVLAVYSGMHWGWAAVFSFSDPVGLAVFAMVYRALPVPLDLRSPNSFAMFVFVSFVSGIFGSSGALIWVLATSAPVTAVLPIWQGWWLGAFLQNVLLVAPVLFFATPRILRWRAARGLQGSEAPHTRGRVLGMTATITGGVLAYLFIATWLTTRHAEEVLRQPTLDALTSVTRLQNAADQAILSVVTILVAFLAFFGYQLFVLWWSATARSSS